ncbi:hypothetical protein N7491_006276 [Penicillium cf. griseofulvum]|nr:hypothetical protein N7491_006276 [Penicillium cf. griseofulvum]
MDTESESIPGIPSTPQAGSWSKHTERLTWSVAKEGDLVKYVFIKFIMAQEKKRESVVRPTMGLQSER